MLSEIWFSLIDRSIELEETYKTHFNGSKWNPNQSKIREERIKNHKKCPKCNTELARYIDDDEIGYRCPECNQQGIRIIRPSGFSIKSPATS